MRSLIEKYTIISSNASLLPLLEVTVKRLQYESNICSILNTRVSIYLLFSRHIAFIHACAHETFIKLFIDVRGGGLGGCSPHNFLRTLHFLGKETNMHCVIAELFSLGTCATNLNDIRTHQSRCSINHRDYK